MKKVIPGLLVILFFAVNKAIAQGPGPPPGGIPIDGGLSLFLAAGAVAGAKLLYDARKQPKEEQDDVQDR
jgi:hypothetical protein